jgi:gluconate 2-dehydrogenase gamma chain
MSRRITRRKFIKISGGSLLAVGVGVSTGRIIALPPDMELPEPYPELLRERPSIPTRGSNVSFFNDHQYTLVATLAALIVPTDEDPGATEAGVVDYIDRLVAESKSKQTVYVMGLEWLDGVSRERYGRDFLGLAPREQIELLQSIDNASSMRKRYVSNFIERVDRKIDKIWDDLFGIGKNSSFFRVIREDVFHGYYSNPISWDVVGYFGPPQPNGYPDFAEPPSGTKYTGAASPINNGTCQKCHFDQKRKKSHRKKIECMECHSIHDSFTREK